MTLIPKRPPGRPDRKALAFTSEIGRLHSHGYSCEAIRLTLEEAGLIVSRSTVTREVARWVKQKGAHSPAVAVTPVAAISAPRVPTSQPSSAPAAGPRFGQRFAASWMDGRITNSIFRARTDHESSSH